MLSEGSAWAGPASRMVLQRARVAAVPNDVFFLAFNTRRSVKVYRHMGFLTGHTESMVKLSSKGPGKMEIPVCPFRALYAERYSIVSEFRGQHMSITNGIEVLIRTFPDQSQRVNNEP